MVTVMARNFLHHPLVQSLGRIEFAVFDTYGDNTLSFLAIDEVLQSEPDLIFFAHGESNRLDDASFSKLERYMRRGGACMLVQPQDETGLLPTRFQNFLGIECDGWNSESERTSTPTNHPIARILGRIPGEVVYLHRHYWRSMQLRPVDAEVLTRFSTTNAPDLVLSRRARCAIFASDVLCDVFRNQRSPAYSGPHDAVGRLIANVVRYLLDADPLEQPLPVAIVEAEPYFFACGLGRFVYEKICQLSKQPTENNELIATSLVIAARTAINGTCHDAGVLLQPVFGKMGQHIARFNPVRSYLFRGWHGGVLFPRSGLQGIIGYAEWGWPDFAIDWMRHQVDLAQRYGGKRLNEIPAQTWDVLREFKSPFIAELKTHIAAGLVETVRGFWSHAYLESVGEESNIRQIAYGKQVLRELFGAEVTSYLCPLDHYEYHPQLPQLLREFGYERAYMSNWGYCGRLRKLDVPFIAWQGKDGTTIPAIPSHAGDLTTKLLSNVLSVNAAKAKVVAQQRGMASVAIGGSQDATVDSVYEREQAIYNQLGNLESRCVTIQEYFTLEKPAALPEHRFDMDDMEGHPEGWSGYGSIAETGRRDREFECKLLACESLHALAVLQGMSNRAHELRACWNTLLTSQDHFIYGCGAAANCEAYDTSGLQYPHILNYAGPRIPLKQEDLIAEDLRAKDDLARTIGLEALLKLVSTAAPAKSADLVIMNPLAWARREWVEVTVEFALGRLRSVVVKCDGKPLPTDVNALEVHPDGSLRRAKIGFAAELPPMGWRRFQLAAGSPRTAATSGASIENEYFVVEVNPATGAVYTLIHKATGRNLIQSDPGANVFEYEGQGLVSSRQTPPQIAVTAGPARQSIAVTGMIGPHPYRTNITLFAGVDRIDFESEVDCGAGAIFGHKGRPATILKVRFPLSFAGQRLVHQPFGVYTTARNVQAVLDFSAIRGTQDLTVVVSSLGIPGHYLSESEIDLLIGDGFPPVYGVQRYSYRLFCLAGEEATPTRMVRRAREWMVQPWCVCAPAGRMGAAKSWLGFGEPFVPTAVLIEDDRLTVRLYNCSDHDATLDFIDDFGLGPPEFTTLGGTAIPGWKLGSWKIAQLKWRIPA